MTKWFAYFKEGKKLPHFKLISSRDISTGEMMAEELAVRNGNEFIGIIVAPQFFQGKDK